MYEIEPYVGVGPIRFGMTREEVRAALDSEVELARKAAHDGGADFFTALGIFVDFTPPGTCEAVEFAGPASPVLAGAELLGRPYDEVERRIGALDPQVTRGDAGLRSCGCGVGIYAPSASKDPHAPVEGVIVFARGYYDAPASAGAGPAASFEAQDPPHG